MATDKDDDSTYSVPPVHRAFTLLRHIAAGGRCRNASKTARELDINRTTLIRLLHTLEAERMIESDDDGASWQLGPGMLALAADALKSRANAILLKAVAQQPPPFSCPDDDQEASLSARQALNHGHAGNRRDQDRDRDSGRPQ